MDEFDTPSILAIGARLANLAREKVTGDLGEPGDGEPSVAGGRASLAEVDSGREAFDLMRVVSFDLVAIGPGVSDMAPNELARRLRAARPWQKWVFVADESLDDDDERTARSLGALAIVEGPDAWRDVWATARRVRKNAPQTGVPGLRLNAGVLA